MTLKRKKWICVLIAMLLPCAGSFFYFVFLGNHPAARTTYLGVKIFTLLWPLICIVFVWRAGFPKLKLNLRSSLKAIPLGLISGMAIVVAMLIVMDTPVREVVWGSQQRIAIKAEALGTMAHYWLFAFLLSVVHSFIEEYYWRWFVYGTLRELVRQSAAHLLAGVAFASHHVVVLSQFFPMTYALVFGALVGVGGMLWSFLFEKQGTLVGIWISHIIVDLGIMTLGAIILGIG